MVRTESTLQQTTATLKTAQKAKAEIDKMADRWDRRTEAKAKLEVLESQRNPIEVLKLQLATAVQAETLRNSVDADRSARVALSTLQASIKRELKAAIGARDEAQVLPVSVVLLDLLSYPVWKT